MSGKQTTVLWIGLILIAVNLVRKWPEIVSVIFTGAGGGSGSGSGSGDGSASSGNITVHPPGQGVTVPIGGFPITIPV